jgi:hypothetical protein
LFIGALEVLMYLTVEEGNEIWDAGDLVSLWCILYLRCITSSEDEVWVFVSLGSCLECWLNSHAWWTRWAPEI